MQYSQAFEALKIFSTEPLDPSSVNLHKLMDIRRAARIVVRTIEARSEGTLVTDHVPNRTKPVESTPTPKEEPRRVLIVDMIREAGEAGCHEHVLYKQFKLSFKDLRKEISNSYGIVTSVLDSTNDHTFYYLADSEMLFAQKYDGKLPPKHMKVGW